MNRLPDCKSGGGPSGITNAAQRGNYGRNDRCKQRQTKRRFAIRERRHQRPIPILFITQINRNTLKSL